MFLSVCAFSVMDLIVKWSDNYPLGQVIFFRGFFGIVFYYFIIPKQRIKEDQTFARNHDKHSGLGIKKNKLQFYLKRKKF